MVSFGRPQGWSLVGAKYCSTSDTSRAIFHMWNVALLVSRGQWLGYGRISLLHEITYGAGEGEGGKRATSFLVRNSLHGTFPGPNTHLNSRGESRHGHPSPHIGTRSRCAGGGSSPPPHSVLGTVWCASSTGWHLRTWPVETMVASQPP
jgi:hypothetical protein